MRSPTYHTLLHMLR